MNTKQVSITNWSARIIIGASIPFTLIIIGSIVALVSETHGIVDATTEQAIFFGGLYLAIPCGLLNVFVGINILSKGLIKKWVAITGIIIGILSILIGLIAWVWYYMIWSFMNHFG